MSFGCEHSNCCSSHHLHFKDLGDTNVVSKCSWSVNLVIENCFDVASDTLPLYKI